jgi:hypothetical protein
MVTPVPRDTPVFAGMNSSPCPRALPPAGETWTALVFADTACHAVVQPLGAALTSTRKTDAVAGSTVPAKKNSKRVPCAGNGVEGNDAMVTVKVQGVGGPEGDVVVAGELPQAADATIAVAPHRHVSHARSVRMF